MEKFNRCGGSGDGKIKRVPREWHQPAPRTELTGRCGPCRRVAAEHPQAAQERISASERDGFAAAAPEALCQTIRDCRFRRQGRSGL